MVESLDFLKCIDHKFELLEGKMEFIIRCIVLFS